MCQCRIILFLTSANFKINKMYQYVIICYNIYQQLISHNIHSHKTHLYCRTHSLSLAIYLTLPLSVSQTHKHTTIICRDIKSSNILLTTNGKAKISDFGLTPQILSSMGNRQNVIGSPYWMAPGTFTPLLIT